MSGSRLGRCLLALASLLATGAARAGELAHTVRPGESAASLAKKYYGDPDQGELLLRYNGRSIPRIRTGERLRVPYCDAHEARMGDSWSELARLHLGRASADSTLAELNGSAPGEPLEVGESIVLPVVLRHSLASGETLTTIARRFYGDGGKAGLLRAFNRIQDARRLPAGTKLEIPLVSLRLREVERERALPEAATRKPADAPALEPTEIPETAPLAEAPAAASTNSSSHEPERHFEEGIVEAQRSFTGGDYDRAREILETLREIVASTGTAWDRHELGRLLAFVYIAFDRDDEACDAYLSTSLPLASGELDPDLVSPRILHALSRCPAAQPQPFPRLDSPGLSHQISPHAGQER